MKVSMNLRKKIILSFLLNIFFLSGYFIQPQFAEAALQAVSSANNPSNGFPNWYQDSTGLKIGQCIEGSNGLADPNCVLPSALEEPNFDLSTAISFPNNFPSEFFYYIAESETLNVGRNGTGKAIFRIALEGAFASIDGSPQAGQQITFLRLNLKKISGLKPKSVYTVTHPFGRFQFETDSLGNTIITGSGQAYRAEDGSFAPGASDVFSALLPATNTNISIFLKAVSPTPPPGYLGNPAILQTITSGPNGNFFRIDGPDVGGNSKNTIQTDRWSVAGKIFSNPNSVLNSINVVPSAVTVPVGGTQQFTANGIDQLGEPMPVTVSWTSSSPLVGTIDTAGLFSAQATGSATVTATSGTVNGNATVTVSPAGEQPVLTTITVSPAITTINVGATLQYTATALDQFGGPYPATIIWTSSNPLVGTINLSTGLFSSMSSGIATISAIIGTVSGNATVTVNSSALQGVGVPDMANGFPNWYQDSTGLKIGQCIEGSNGLADPNCVLPSALEEPNFDLSTAISFPNNFPSEFFYWIVDSDKLAVGPNLSGRAIFRMALEGAFATGIPEAGQQQITFLRVNLKKMSGLKPGSTYTVTYPFGKFTFKSDSSGNAIVTTSGQAYRAEDGSFAPGASDVFSALLPATNTNISIFLKAVSPTPPPGYLGNPAILQTITSGPNGNFFRIDGPDVGGKGVNTAQTNLWSVAGKIYSAPNMQTIYSVDPVNKAVSVPIEKTIIVTFTESVEPGTTYDKIVLLKNDSKHGQKIDIAKRLVNNLLFIDPTKDLQPGKTYTLILPKDAVEYISGTYLPREYTFTFTTAN